MNPYSNGSTSFHDEQDGKYPDDINGYFNNAPSSSPNPYNGGAGNFSPQEQQLAQSMSDALDSLDAQRAESPASDVAASNAEFYDDQGYSPSGSGRS